MRRLETALDHQSLPTPFFAILIGVTLVGILVAGLRLVSDRSDVLVDFSTSPLLGDRLESLLVSGDAGMTVLVGTHGATALSRDGGRTLTRCPALDGFDADVSSGTASGQHMIVAGLMGAMRSDDLGKTWREVAATLPVHVVDAVALDARAPDSLVVSTAGSGIYASDDGGAMWSRLTAPPADPTGSGVLRGRTILLPVLPTGLVRSVDGGAHWSLAARDAGGTLLAADPHDSARLLLSGSGLLFVSSDGGASWQQQPIPDGAQLVTAANDGSLVAAGFTADQHALIWRSYDRGETWQSVLAEPH
ncbi:MAG TPA: sialidase family protein [Candidatus Baltobacteraceae bacterium]